MERLDRRLGALTATPMLVLLGLCFLAPLAVVAGFSVMPSKVFDLWHQPDFSAYAELLRQGYWKSLAWSLGMALASTLILLVLCWPLAYAMAKVYRRFTLILTIGVVMSLFVSENIRLFGWVLTLMKGGLIEGYLRHWTGTGFDGLLYNMPVIVFGLVYVYLPFMLFPLAQGISMVPDDARQAAADLGASRARILWEIDLPLAAPGIVVGCLLTFVLATGAVAESKLLGGQAVIVIADEVETAFTYGQDWPLGSALAMVLIAIVGAIAIVGVNRVDLDAIMGRRR
ncbi:ABC transporter permease [Rhodospira trueperi]|uniref:Spermidine/putrescine transport system permease protein n=1 Tax=Rhodospira trueperi TaxID=69960 RepID=A0A1G7DB14_9PROT|nr:ABC transporter permease [Rhodospira trueperi]SDE48838.1 spermidine/putrescine transport system permease protein [Rhodospira trueperi]